MGGDGEVITFIVATLIQWLYDWGEWTYDTRCFLTFISTLECVAFFFGTIGFCCVELPDILKDRKKKKREHRANE